MKRALTILSAILLFANSLFAQLDSIFDQGTYRTYIMHLPTGYSTINEYPIVLNLHGLLSNATLQQSITEFDSIADIKGFIVVYPNASATLNAWATGNSDVDFLSNLIDTIRSSYSTKNCLFVTGFSNGGFMTYRFANNTRHIINAMAIGSGNMANSLKNSSTSAPQIPVMHFHGTADSTVPYIGIPPFITPVDSTIQWWVQHNNSNTSPVFTAIPNANLTDSSTVEKYYYGGGSNGSEVTFYKVINGGHTWSGSSFNLPFGFTNQDINQSAIIGDFFDRFCSATTGLNDGMSDNSFSIYPNPINEQLTITTLTNDKIMFILYDHLSRQILNKTLVNTLTIKTGQLADGIYFYSIWNSNRQIESGKIIKN